MIRFGPEVCGDLEASSRREWLETNGIGGFASATITGLHTRRYHGLLTAATRPPAGRVLLLSRLEETLVVDGRRYELGVNRYPGAVHPQGHRHLAGFRLDPFPISTYEVEGLRLEKSVFMLRGKNATAVLYELMDAPAGAACRLELRPLVAFRDYHSTTHRNDALDPTVRIEPGQASLAPYAGLPRLHLAHDADDARPTGEWYLSFEYDEERARGLDFSEDLFQPLLLATDLGARRRLAVIAGTEPIPATEVDRLRRAEIERRARVIAAAPPGDAFAGALAAAADQFVVDRSRGKTVIAGYPWFTDWGRDTMIALPGLALTTGRLDVARDILLELARHVDQGMVPNRFPDAGEAPEYNTVDATLWYVEAVRAFAERAADPDLVRTRLYPVLLEILDWHVRGTRYGIRMDEDGLLASGAEGVQLTWMDARVGDWVVTPRRGKPVEIQALWYNALRVMEDLAGAAGDGGSAERFGALAVRARASFNRLFWNEDAGCLYDVVDGAERDGSIRPNQVLAASLPHTMLAPERIRALLHVVERELLTPYGLRTLAPGDPRYRPRYEGDVASRDSAYHQGTVWPWLLGPFVRAWLRAHGDEPGARERAARWLEPLRSHLRDAGLGQISEIFDAEAPHLPRGCFAQAWSVAEVLRAAVEDLPASERPHVTSEEDREPVAAGR